MGAFFGGLIWALDNGVFTGYNGCVETAGPGYNPDVYGRITQQLNTIDGKTLSAGYGYDLADRITSVTAPDGNTAGYEYYPNTNWVLTCDKYAYRYDANGNMRAKGTILSVAGSDVAVADVNEDEAKRELEMFAEKWDSKYASIT